MARHRTGSAVARKIKKGNRIKTIWYARITYIDAGNRKQRWQKALNKSDAKDRAKQMLRELDDHGEETINAARMTFAQLADYYKKKYLVEAQYVDGRKVEGLRSLDSVISRWTTIKDYFGKKQLRSITYGDIKKFRSDRLKMPTIRNKPRSITSVNRELEVLRKMFNIAHREGWVIKNPFTKGDVLISKSDEKKRERILTREEEEKLLAACIGRREHIKPIIICAIDTGMRRGEILKLKWADLDFDNQLIMIEAFNTKTMRERQVAMTKRLASELRSIYERSTKEADALIFGITDNVKKAFNSARKIAELPDVRFHDLRHTHATRLVAAHIPLSEVGRVLGHTQANTTYRYVNANIETVRRTAAVLDEFNKKVNVENELVSHTVIN
jgi:integrase